MNKLRIKSASAITGMGLHLSQDKFDFDLNQEKTLIEVDLKYPEILAVRSMRRMSKAVKIGVLGGLSIAKGQPVEAIVTCTGLGCLEDTVKFLDPFIKNESQVLSPTSFIQSTHNTVGGNLAIMLGTKGYNMTYTQRELSFCSGLIDAQLQGNKTVLCGAFDEQIDLTKEVFPQLKCSLNSLKLGEGGAFFLLSETGEIAIESIELISKSELNLNLDLDIILTNSSGIQGDNIVNYGNISGSYFTADAVGVFLADNILRHSKGVATACVIHEISGGRFIYYKLSKS